MAGNLLAGRQVWQAMAKHGALELAQKELEMQVERLQSVSFTATLLLGSAYESLVHLEVDHETVPMYVYQTYYCSASAVVALSLYVVCTSIFACVFGHRLALQGPQGSHDVAVETLRHESVLIFVAFGLSLVSMIVCACAMAVIAFGPGAAAACAVFMTSLLAQAWRLCVLTSELKANHRFLQQSWHVKTKEGADFDLAKTVLTYFTIRVSTRDRSHG